MSLKINHITNTLQVDDSAVSANIVLVPKGTGFVDLSSATLASNATNTGALVVGGGIGVGGSITVGGSLTVVGGISASITGVSTTATNIGGGSAGQIHIQSAPGVTTFVPAGTDGYLLQYQTGNTASFVSTTTLQVGIATTATNVSGGVVNVTTGTFSSTINATSTITGALKVAGGVGVGGNIYVGSGATPTLYTDTSGNVSLGTTTPTAQLHVFNSINDGVKIRVENSGTGTNSYVQLNTQANGVTLYNYAFAETYTNANGRYVTASGLVESTGNGGLGLSALSTSATSKISFYTGGNNERIRISSLGTTTILSSIIANSTTTGALQVIGGVGVGGNMYVGGTVSATNFILNGYQVSTGTYTGGNVADATTFLSTVTILVTATSTSTTTGALQVAGGVGIGRDLYVGGTVTATILRTLSTNIALGYGAGLTTQGQSIAIGNNAGRTSQSNHSVAIGDGAGISTQSSYSIAIGDSAGGVGQGQAAVAVGFSAGNSAQGIGSVAVGNTAGNDTQGVNAVAVGRQAGQSMQGTLAVAVGLNAGSSAQGYSSVAVGNNAGQTNQGIGSVAIGNSAGTNNQGAYAVALGNAAGVTYQTTSSIVLNARSTTLNAANSGFYVAPIRGDATTSGTTYGLYYNIATNEITSSTTGIVAGSAGTATSIASGRAGQIPIQNSTGSTTFIPSGAAGTLLQAGAGSTATFVTTGTIRVGYADSANSATTATGAASASFANNITNGAIGQIPIQSSAGVTTFIPAGTNGQVLTFGTNTATWTTAVGNATNATNLSGGAQYQIPYQSGVGATAFSANLEFDGNSLFVNVGSATQLNTGYTNRLNVSGGIVAGTAASTNGSIILQGLYGANGAITNFGTEYSTGGPVLGYGVYPSGVSSGAFLSSGPAALSRGAYTISGNVHNWYIGGSQTTAIGNPVTMTLAMTLTATGALAFSGASNYGSSGYVLQSNGNSAPTWVALSGVSSGSASVANNIAGGSANQIPYQSGAGSTSFTANLTWDGTNLNVNSSPALTKSTAASTGLTAYDLSNFLNGKPLSSEVVMRVLMVRSCSFAGNFAGSYASAGTAPSAAAGVSMIIYKQGVAIGTITFAQNSTSGVFATTGGTAVSFIAGNQLVIQVDNSVNGQDPSFSDMALTLFGTVAV